MRLLRFERRWLAAVFDTILPSDASRRLPVGARDLPLDRFVRDLLRRAPLTFAAGVRIALWITVFAPLFLHGKRRLFPSLDPEHRLAVLRRLQRSSSYAIRELPNILKMVACLGWGGHPAVRERIGLASPSDPPPAWLGEGEDA